MDLRINFTIMYCFHTQFVLEFYFWFFINPLCNCVQKYMLGFEHLLALITCIKANEPKMGKLCNWPMLKLTLDVIHFHVIISSSLTLVVSET